MNDFKPPSGAPPPFAPNFAPNKGTISPDSDSDSDTNSSEDQYAEMFPYLCNDSSSDSEGEIEFLSLRSTV